jgi:glycine cleavage system aminomethyltransferase T
VDAGVLPGTITYTQWLNRTGRLEADLTVTKLPSQHQYQQQHTSGWEGSDGGGGGGSHDFMVVATDTMHRHVESWMKRHIAALDAHSGMGGGGVGLSESDGNDSGSLNWNGGNPGLDGNGEAVTWGNITADGSNAYATVTDVTGALAQLNLQGPLSRAILARAIAGEPPVGSGGGGGGSGSGEGEAGVGEGTEEVFEEDPACAHEREEAAAYAVSDEAFPFRAAKECYIGFARCTVTRITYVGELGYEIFAPAEQASQVLEVLHAAARRLGREQLVFLDEGIAAEDPEGIGAGAAGGSGSGGSIGGIGGEGGQPRKVVQGPRYWAERLAAGGVPYAGLKALGSLRMEKGYRDYGHDLDNTDSLAEGGLAFTANLARVTKHTGHFSPAFIGSDKMAAQKERGVKELPRRLVGVLLTPKKKTTAAAGGEGAAQDDRGGAGAGAGTAAASSDGGDASDGAAASDGGGGADAEGVSGGASGEGAAGEGGDESEETAFMFHGEVVLRDGEVVGDVRAASYGHTLGGAVGLAMVSGGK